MASRALADLFQTRLETEHLSPAAVQAHRAAIINENAFVYATHNAVSISRLDASAVSDHLSNPLQSEGKKTGMVSASFVLPEPERSDLMSLATPAEIQSIRCRRLASGDVMIAAVDCRGAATVAIFPASIAQDDCAPLAYFSLQLPGVVESGWAGIDLWPADTTSSHSSSGLVAVGHSFSRVVALFQLPAASSSSSSSSSGPLPARLLAQWHTSLPVTGVALVKASPDVQGGSGSAAQKGKGAPPASSSSPAAAPTAWTGLQVVCTEMSMLTAWDAGAIVEADAAAGEKGESKGFKAPVYRDSPGGSTEVLQCLAVDGSHVGVAGGGGAVWVFEAGASSWRARGTWYAPAKYEILGIVLSAAAGLCYVAGADQEILCGKWEQQGMGGQAGKGKRKGGGAGEGRTMHAGGFTGGKTGLPAAASSGTGADVAPAGAAAAVAAVPGVKRGRDEGVGSGGAGGAPSGEAAAGGGGSKAAGASAAAVVVSDEGDEGAAGAVKGVSRFRYTGFRGDSRWVGLSLLQTGEGGAQASAEHVLVAVTEGGWGYVVRQAQKMDSSAAAAAAKAGSSAAQAGAGAAMATE